MSARLLMQSLQFAQSSSSPSHFIMSQTGSLLKVSLNRPKALNSLNLDMINQLSSLFPALENSKAIWMEGTGGKAFCAGGDVKALFEPGATVEQRDTFFRSEFTLDYKLSQLTKTVRISCWDGIVMGGGIGISAYAPIIIATENTMLAMPEAKIGFFTDIGSGFILSKLRKRLGYYLGMTASRLKGQQVYLAGLAHFYIPREKLPAAFNEVSAAISKSATNDSAKNLELMNSILTKFHTPTGMKGLQYENAVEHIFSQPTVPAIYKTAKEGKQPFYQQVAKSLQQQCPFSVHLIHKSITTCQGLTLKQCFQHDFMIAQHMIRGSDFGEGVRCLLIEKGATPKWRHAHLNDVKETEVAQFLKPLKGGKPLEI